MKIHLLFGLVILTTIFSVQISNTQTTLAADDIAFTGYSCDDNTVNGGTANDDICFILLKNIMIGTIINFTDFGWHSDASAFQSKDLAALSQDHNLTGCLSGQPLLI